MTSTKLADEYADIAKRLKEIEGERWKAIKDSKLPDQVGEVATGWPYTASTDQDFIC